MKLVFPYRGELRGPDLRFFRLAEFLGAPCRALPLSGEMGRIEDWLDKAVSDRTARLVVSPSGLKELTGGRGLRPEFVSRLLSRFPQIIVHGIRADAFDPGVVAALSSGTLRTVRAISGGSSTYEISRRSADICGAFAGLSFGPAHPANDRVLSIDAGSPQVRTLISIEGRPFMAQVKAQGAEVLFIASKDTADPNETVGDAPLAQYFSRFVPQAMAIRYAAGDECWRPSKPFASIIIDDPLLREQYGFLNFESLLRLADEHNFHASIAFIPHNFRRNSPRIARMFHDNAARLSMCFHGNDHTAAEFASHDPALLNTLLRVAEDRMIFHRSITGIPCDRVMVFPQGTFSIESMKALQSHNFRAAVNTTQHLAGDTDRLTLADLAQPAVLEYGSFPLFLRKTIERAGSHDIAFNLFFGRPVLIVEHHDDFKRPESLVEIAAKINAVAPGVRWSNLASVVGNSILTRKAPDGVRHVRAYSGTVRISNDSGSARRYSIEWRNSCDIGSVEHVLLDRRPFASFEVEQGALRLSAEIGPGNSREFSVIHRDGESSLRNLGVTWNAKAFVRRRLSEFRDNYLCRNKRFLEAARAVHRRLLKS